MGRRMAGHVMLEVMGVIDRSLWSRRTGVLRPMSSDSFRARSRSSRSITGRAHRPSHQMPVNPNNRRPRTKKLPTIQMTKAAVLARLIRDMTRERGSGAATSPFSAASAPSGSVALGSGVEGSLVPTLNSSVDPCSSNGSETGPMLSSQSLRNLCQAEESMKVMQPVESGERSGQLARAELQTT